MSLESQIAALVMASNGLTGEVAAKMAQIDAKVAAEIAELEAWRAGVRSEYPAINTFTNNLLWSNAAAGVEDGTVGVKGALPTGFYAWVANAEVVILGTRPLVDGEYGFIRPQHYCPVPQVLRVRVIPRPGVTQDYQGVPAVPLPLAWGYPMSVAGRNVTLSVWARLASGVMTGEPANSQVVGAQWKRVVSHHNGDDGLRAYYGQMLVGMTAPIELEFMLPHAFLGYLPDEHLPVYARAMQLA